MKLLEIVDMVDIKELLAIIVYTFFDDKIVIKPVIKIFKRRKVYARFKGNIWAKNLAEMGSLSSKNKNVKYLLCVIDAFTKYAWVKPLKDKKSKTVLNDLIEIVNESNRKPNKLWVDQGRQFYKKLMQEWLENNDILMYCTDN